LASEHSSKEKGQTPGTGFKMPDRRLGVNGGHVDLKKEGRGPPVQK